MRALSEKVKKNTMMVKGGVTLLLSPASCGLQQIKSEKKAKYREILERFQNFNENAHL